MLSKTMVSLSLVTVLILTSCLYQAGAAPAKEKRSLWELNTVISCYTGRSGFDYNGYGCWCGLGGSGAPVDDTDTCCMAHDYCYQSVQDSNCGVYFSSYQYTEQDCSSGSGTIACAGYLTDPNPTTVCHFRLCECDRLLAKCLRRYEDSYNPDFAGFEKRFCEARLAQPVVTYHTNTTVTVVGGDETGAYQQVPDQVNPNQPVDAIPAQRGVLGQLDAMPKQRGVLQQLDAIPQQRRDA